MGLTVPPAVNYPTPLVSLPVVWNRDPVEGDRIVPAEIDWGAMGGANNCVNFNLFGNAAETISQIVALSVDNSNCSVPVIFVFPDTAQTYEVKALTPVATFTVFTNQTQFFVSAPGALSTDVTRFGILNSQPFPVSLAESPQVIPPPTPQTAGVGNINAGATGNTQIVAGGVNGTLTGFNITFNFPSAPPQIFFNLQDGTGKLIYQGVASASGTAVNMTGLEIPFTNGLVFHISPNVGPAGSVASCNVYYTVP